MTKKSKIPHLRVLIRGQPVTVDKLVYIALISPIMALPQLYSVITTGAQGVSAVTWGTFLVVAVVWLSYGLKHRIKPIIIVQSCWILIDAAIVTSLILKT